MKRFYLSKYLIFSDMEDSVLLFNGFSGNMDVISDAFATKLQNTGLGGEIDYLTSGELLFMIRRGHVTELDSNAQRGAFQKLVLDVHKKNCAGPKSGYLSLLMSYDCNLSCPYCYQADVRRRNAPVRMTEELLDLIFYKHYDSLFPGVDPKTLMIEFYGGEPFLPSNGVLIRRTVDFARKYGIRLSAISNATDITVVKDFLGPLPGMINSVQVTLDTTKAGREMPRSTGGWLPEIIDSVHSMLDKKVKTTIRMHVNGDNYSELNDAVDYLVEQEIVGHPMCDLYLAPIRKHRGGSVPDQYLDTTNPIAKEISRKLGHSLHVSAEGIRTMLSFRNGRLSRTMHCMLSSPTMHVVDPFGDIYGCYEEAGWEDVKTGHISNAGVAFSLMRGIYNTRILNNMDKCLDCPFALLCAGGCAYHARRREGTIMAPDCYNIKESIMESLKYVYSSNKRSNNACSSSVTELDV